MWRKIRALFSLDNESVYISDLNWGAHSSYRVWQRKTAKVHVSEEKICAKNLRIQWKSFLLYCFCFQLCFLPADTETLCLYSQFLSRSFKSTSAIKNYISGVKTMHLLLGYTIEKINSFLINLSLKGIARLNPYCVKQARAITSDIYWNFPQCLIFQVILIVLLGAYFFLHSFYLQESQI